MNHLRKISNKISNKILNTPKDWEYMIIGCSAVGTGIGAVVGAYDSDPDSDLEHKIIVSTGCAFMGGGIGLFTGVLLHVLIPISICAVPVGMVAYGFEKYKSRN